jgi:MazG family protein
MSGKDNPGASFERLCGVMRELRTRCPWDREQTASSLAGHLVEEAYEALDAIENGDAAAIADELGDVIAQALAVATILWEEAPAGVDQILEHAADKLIRRHEHIYGDASAATADEVVANWNRIKGEERRAAGAGSALDGIARTLPALTRAQKLGSRAREAGMDWRDIHEVLAQVREEMDEVEGALARNDLDAAAEEIGDMLLALGNAPRFIQHDAEATLRRACDKFTERFKSVERLASERGVDLRRLTPVELQALWDEVKSLRSD